MPKCMVDKTLAGAVSLANYLTAAGFDHHGCFLSAGLAVSKRVVPMMTKLRLRELPLTKGLLFGGQWTPPVESTTKT